MLNQQAADNPNHSRPVISIVGSETAAWAKLEEAQVSTMEGIPLITLLDDQSYFDMGDRYYTLSCCTSFSSSGYSTPTDPVPSAPKASF
jgi:hypothetical protein